MAGQAGKTSDEARRMRLTLRNSTAILAALLALYVIAFPGFNAVAKQVADQLRFHEIGKPIPYGAMAATPIGF